MVFRVSDEDASLWRPSMVDPKLAKGIIGCIPQGEVKTKQNKKSCREDECLENPA